MNLSKLSNAEKRDLCLLYFKAGFLLLPFVWFVNAGWFFAEAFRRPPYDEQKAIKKYVILSFIGGVTWLTLLIIWIVIFQINRAYWGEIGEKISFTIPTGRA